MILIVPDVHGRKFWKEPCSNVEKYDKIIFLGDYLDPYVWIEDITKEDAIDNFKEIISFARENKDKVVLLLGNHCMPYINEYFFINANGGRHDRENHDAIEKLYKDNIDLFSLAYERDINGKKYLFSHAGVCKSWYTKYKELIGELTAENLNNILKSEEGIKTLCDIGISRWGGDSVGSIVWADYKDHNFNSEKFDDIYQIFGHTQQKSEPIIKKRYACLDVRKCFELDDEGNINNI